MNNGSGIINCCHRINELLTEEVSCRHWQQMRHERLIDVGAVALCTTLLLLFPAVKYKACTWGGGGGGCVSANNPHQVDCPS